MEHPEQPNLNCRFKDLLLSVYGDKKINLYSSDATPRDKALCFLAAATIAAQTAIAIAKVDLLNHAFVIATALGFAILVCRRR
jgi:hypothetical protein